ncbi:MAG: hypothetical protein ACOC85_04690 [Thermoplasmatota archaeon]
MPIKDRKKVAVVVIVIIILISALIYFHLSRPLFTCSHSFEENWDGWKPQAIDVDDPEVNWTIERTSELTYSGNYSMKFHLENWHDQGKIWIQRTIDLEPEKNYNVRMKLSFASSDFGSFNLWKILVGGGPHEPEDIEDLTYPENTGIGADEDNGYQWMEKEYKFDAKTNSEGEMYIYVGVWGTWETERTYYVDDIEVVVTRIL